MLCKQPQTGKGFDVHIHRPGKSLDERAAARRTGLVEHDGIDGVIFHLEALDVLPADIDDEIRLRIEMECRLEMRHRLHDPEIHFERRFDQVLAVSRHRAGTDIDPVSRQGIDFPEFIQDNVERLAVVRLVMRIQNAVIVGDQNHLRGRRTAVDSQISVPAIGMNVRKAQIALFVPGDKLVILRLIFEKRLAGDDVVAALAVPDFGDDLFHGYRVYIFRIQRRTQRHEARSILRKHRVLLVQLERPGKREAKRF